MCSGSIVLKALVFPNDPLIAYLKKGELKERYFNPLNVFDEVHFITFNDTECSIEDIQKTIGDAKGVIHRLNRLSIIDMFFPFRRFNEIETLVKTLDFDVVRSYNPIFYGYFAGRVAEMCNTPFLMSLHGNYDLDIRYQYFKNKDKRFIKYLLTKLYVEPLALSSVSHVLGAYQFAAQYALDNGVSEDKVSIIYNRVYFDRFKPSVTEKDTDRIGVICVGRLIQEKGQRRLIDAIPMISENVHFTFVGDGEDYELLLSMVKDRQIEARVTFIKSIPNQELAGLYREHDIFALPIEYGGVCIPALEATASGLALVMPQPIHEDVPEVVGTYAEVVPNTPEGFAMGINKVAENRALRHQMVVEGLNVIEQISGSVMERKEAALYQRLVEESNAK